MLRFQIWIHLAILLELFDLFQKCHLMLRNINLEDNDILSYLFFHLDHHLSKKCWYEKCFKLIFSSYMWIYQKLVRGKYNFFSWFCQLNLSFGWLRWVSGPSGVNPSKWQLRVASGLIKATESWKIPFWFIQFWSLYSYTQIPKPVFECPTWDSNLKRTTMDT